MRKRGRTGSDKDAINGFYHPYHHPVHSGRPEETQNSHLPGRVKPDLETLPRRGRDTYTTFKAAETPSFNSLEFSTPNGHLVKSGVGLLSYHFLSHSGRNVEGASFPRSTRPGGLVSVPWSLPTRVIGRHAAVVGVQLHTLPGSAPSPDPPWRLHPRSQKEGAGSATWG